MKYKFIGKPDGRFPGLIIGKVYELEVRTYNGFLDLGTAKPYIFMPFYCPYSSWETFYQNWEPHKI